MAEPQPSKLVMRVRFPSPAPLPKALWRGDHPASGGPSACSEGPAPPSPRPGPDDRLDNGAMSHRSRVCHFVIDVDDLDKATDFWAAALGATRYARRQERGFDFWVMQDPWGNEFCVLETRFPELLAEREPWPASYPPPACPTRATARLLLQLNGRAAASGSDRLQHEEEHAEVLVATPACRGSVACSPASAVAPGSVRRGDPRPRAVKRANLEPN